MDLDVTITRSGEAGKQRRVELVCHAKRGVLQVTLAGSTISESMARQFAWFADNLMSDANLRTLDQQAFQAWQRAGAAADNAESASRRWRMSEAQLLSLQLHVTVVMEKGSRVISSFFEPYSESSMDAAEPPQA
jgi:hypothetical protein